MNILDKFLSKIKTLLGIQEPTPTVRPRIGKIEFGRTEDGLHTCTIYNMRGQKVAELKKPVTECETALVMAIQFAKDHPDLFIDDILVDTSEVSQEKNPDLYGDGKLDAVPENQ